MIIRAPVDRDWLERVELIPVFLLWKRFTQWARAVVTITADSRLKGKGKFEHTTTQPFATD